LIYALILATIFAVPYEQEDFYRNTDVGKKSLPFTNSVFCPNKEVKSFLESAQSEPYTPEPKDNGFVIKSNSKEDAYRLIDILLSRNVKFYPIVLSDGVRCIASEGRYRIKVKDFVTQKRLRERLESRYGVSVISISFDGNIYEVLISGSKLNPFAFANMVSDDAWFYWCQPKLTSLDGDIVVVGEMLRKPAMNSGYYREYILKIKLFSEKINLNNFPKMGRDFRPVGAGDAWCTFFDPVVIREKSDDARIIIVKYKFRYLTIESSYKMSPITLVCDIDGKMVQHYFSDQNLYFSTSMITGTNITDLMSVKDISKPTNKEVPEMSLSYLDRVKWWILGAWLCGTGLFLATINLFIRGIEKISAAFALARISRNEARQNLLKSLEAATRSSDWRREYRNVYLAFVKYLKYKKIPVPETSYYAEGFIKSVMEELEKMYQRNADPDINKLVENVKLV
jgi:hypothetical protein